MAIFQIAMDNWIVEMGNVSLCRPYVTASEIARMGVMKRIVQVRI